MLPSAVPKRNFSKSLQEEVFSLAHASGLRVFLCRKPGFRKQYACYSAFYGSVDSDFVLPSGERLQVPDGIAHFLEHTLFETRKGNASDLFAERGAYSNALTSFTTTSYLFSAASRFYENLELLIEFVENPVFDPVKIEKEQGIIEQEIQGYRDHPYWVSYLGLLENLFQKHPVRVDIAGSPESIRKIDSATLRRCYEAFYHPSNMILFVVGDVEPDRLFPFVDAASRWGSRGGGNGGAATRAPVERRYPGEPKPVLRCHASRRMPVALPKLLLGFKDVSAPREGEEFAFRDLSSRLALEILFGRSSPLFRGLYEEGLILDDFGADYSLGAGVGHAIVGGDTPQPDKLRSALLERITALRRGGIDREDFERLKRVFTGSFIRAFNSLEYIAMNFTYMRFYDFDLFRSPEVLARLDLDAIQERVETLLDPDNYTVFVIEPA